LEITMSPDVPAGAAVLLDFISIPESGGSYTVAFRHVERTLSHPITTLPISELLTLQKHWGNTIGSSAAGRYQIMDNTLEGLVEQGVVKPTDIFSPDVQDRLGYALLQRRGYAAFKGGQLSLDAFALHLAQEWASMPVLVACKGAHREVNVGQSYYAGDGLNKALISAESFETALYQAKAAPA
jgi:hypothetical protein